jgi:hypothetical protein
MYVNAKMNLFKHFRNQAKGMGESSGGGEFSMIYLIHCRNLCKCYSVFPPSTRKKKELK